MSILWHILRRDLRRLWPCLIPWAVVQAAHLAYFWLSPYNHCDGFSLEWLVLGFNSLWACFVTFFQFSEESPIETLASWRLRPIDPRLQFAGRWLAVVLIALVAPLVLSFPVWLYWGANAEEMRRGLAYVSEVYGFGIFLAAIGSSFMGDRRRRILRFAGSVLGTVLTLYAALSLWRLSKLSLTDSWYAYGLFGALGSALLVVSLWIHLREQRAYRLPVFWLLVMSGPCLGLFFAGVQALHQRPDSSSSTSTPLSFEVYADRPDESAFPKDLKVQVPVIFHYYLATESLNLGTYARWTSLQVLVKDEKDQVLEYAGPHGSPFEFQKFAISEYYGRGRPSSTLERDMFASSPGKLGSSDPAFVGVPLLSSSTKEAHPSAPSRVQLKGRLEWGSLQALAHVTWSDEPGSVLRRVDALHFWLYRPLRQPKAYPLNHVWLSYFAPACHDVYSLRFWNQERRLGAVHAKSSYYCHLLGLPWVLHRCEWVGELDGVNWALQFPEIAVSKRIPEGHSWQILPLTEKPLPQNHPPFLHWGD